MARCRLNQGTVVLVVSLVGGLLLLALYTPLGSISCEQRNRHKVPLGEVDEEEHDVHRNLHHQEDINDPNANRPNPKVKGPRKVPHSLIEKREKFEGSITDEQRAECKRWIKRAYSVRSNSTSFTVKDANFVSQSNQDSWLFHQLFANMERKGEKGVYVDLAAGMPRYLSNTYFYDVCLGWSGLCIEASPERAALLRKERGCVVEESCVAEKKQTMVFENLHGKDAELSSSTKKQLTELYNTDPEAFKEKIKTMENVGRSFSFVKCDTFDGILRRHGLYKQQIDLLSLDVEEALSDVMLGMNLSGIDVAVVENKNVEAATSAFKAAGFDMMGATNRQSRSTKIWWDEVWVRRDSRWAQQCDWDRFATKNTRGWAEMARNNFTAILQCDIE